MKQFLIFMLTSTIIYGQVPDKEITYDWDYVLKYVKKSKDETKGTEAIISDITKCYVGENAQMELIKFYKEAYDFKIVDRAILINLVDSLAENGLNERVKQFAAGSRHFVEHRFLDKGIRDFQLPDKDGLDVKLSTLNDKIVIVELWATWCSPCLKEIPKIPALRKKNPNIEFYSISLDKSPDKMKKFIEKNNYDWPIVFGGSDHINPELWHYLNIVAVPKYYTIDRDGTVINVADTLDEEYVLSLK